MTIPHDPNAGIPARVNVYIQMWKDHEETRSENDQFDVIEAIWPMTCNIKMIQEKHVLFPHFVGYVFKSYSSHVE